MALPEPSCSGACRQFEQTRPVAAAGAIGSHKKELARLRWLDMAKDEALCSMKRRRYPPRFPDIIRRRLPANLVADIRRTDCARAGLDVEGMIRYWHATKRASKRALAFVQRVRGSAIRSAVKSHQPRTQRHPDGIVQPLRQSWRVMMARAGG